MKFKYVVLLFSMFFVILLVGGTFSSFYGQITGNISATTDNWSFVANVTNSTTVGDHFSLPLSSSVLSPGSSGSFVVNVDATGTTMDIEYNVMINGSTIPTNMDFCLDSACTDIISKESGTDIILPYNTTDMLDSVTIYWKWTAGKYTNDDANFTSLQVANIFVRSKKAYFAFMKNGYNSVETDRTEFWASTYKPYIRTVIFEIGSVPSTCNIDDLCFDISADLTQKYHVYAYMEDSGYINEDVEYTVGATLYDLHIVSEKKIYAPDDCERLFASFRNLISIDFDNNFETNNVTNMGFMFAFCPNLTGLDVSSFNTSKVTKMVDMFYTCSSLVNLDLSNFDTSNVTNMMQMFGQCSSLISVDLSSFNTSKVTMMQFLFMSCPSLVSVDLSSFNTNNIVSTALMFTNCSSLTNLDLSNFNTSKVTDMESMFMGCSGLVNLDLSNFDTSKVENMTSMFFDCSNLINLNIRNFDFSSVVGDNGSYKGLYAMFYGCSKLITTINMNGVLFGEYTGMFSYSATDASALITVNYTAATSTLVDNMIATKSSDSHVVKGSLIS